MSAIGERGGKDIEVASILKMKLPPEALGSHGKIANAHVGLADTLKGSTQLALVHARDTKYAEASSGKAFHRLLTEKEMRVGTDGRQLPMGSHLIEACCFHDCGIGLIETVALNG